MQSPPPPGAPVPGADDRALLRGILVHDIRRDLRRHLRPMLAWYLLFTLFATVSRLHKPRLRCRIFTCVADNVISCEFEKRILSL